MELHRINVKTTLLKDNIDETIYLVQLENFVSRVSKNMVCKLAASIYRLKQTSHQWYKKFHEVILSFGFEVNVAEDYVYHKFTGSNYIFLVLYVDDILLSTNDIYMVHETNKFPSPRKFEMKDIGKASFVLGIIIHKWAISKRYLKGLAWKPGDTPVAKGDKFSLNQCPK